MDITSLIIFLLIGLAGGWLASLVVGGGGLISSLIAGVIGAFVGPVLLNALGLTFSVGGPLVTSILVSAIGAIVVILIARLVL